MIFKLVSNATTSLLLGVFKIKGFFVRGSLVAIIVSNQHNNLGPVFSVSREELASFRTPLMVL
jgi:hypothetical protein